MKYIIGNLKMELSYNESIKYLNEINDLTKNKEINLERIYLGIALSHDALSLSLNYPNRKFHIGAQNIFHLEKGPYTGEVSIKSAQELKLDFIILGHSLRRQMFNETNQIINDKLLAFEKYNIMPIICIGETLKEFTEEKTKQTIKRQLKKCLQNVKHHRFLISYEPIYAIGNGMVPEISHIENIIKIIKDYVGYDIPVLYGGSVSNSNINTLKNMKNIDGFLVGTAAIDPSNFIAMCKKVND
ncbi:triose-phosphate isomerase [Metamycoplasma salivarium]|uniref:Triosephosphate isomerase n=2 Tax=Metamycoplasma salivarium TaxID=2124 RepID=A0A448ZY53_METSV|nr:triose-phosphate isomerase family protein [Metamycoplasma salivarium]CAD7360900.1 Triosephosphate isomerase [Metamycoplasma salivarium]VEU56096.1 Triosephosphate isomerase [Metamycoplasma salivarium]